MKPLTMDQIGEFCAKHLTMAEQKEVWEGMEAHPTRVIAVLQGNPCTSEEDVARQVLDAVRKSRQGGSA